MSHTPHELAEEFPEAVEKIHALKLRDQSFAALAEVYHLINREIHRAEAQVDAISDEALEQLKRQRLALKDDVALRLSRI